MAVNPGGTGKKPSSSVPQRAAVEAKPSVSANRPPTTPTNAKPNSTAATPNSKPPNNASPSKPNPHGLNELKKLGRYTIVKKIGQGGMGAVFLATDTQLKRQVALKVLPREKAENPILVKRFKAEATAAAQLRHENIVAIHDAGEADGLLYIALEYINGVDAHTLVSNRGSIQPQRAMDIIRQIALALQHAHGQKIVHRDIKPSNLLIGKDGSVKLTDMGLARSVDESMETNITRAGTTVGTVDYMSPEQARNSKAADIRSDLYSLGATWYHLLSGHPPFPDGSMLNKLTAHTTKTRPDIRDENDAVTESIAVIIKRLMAIDPKDRYQTPAELLLDLDNEQLTRGPTSLKDLAALAEGDDHDDDEPRQKYRKPAAKEAKQLMAPTLEIPVQAPKPVEEPQPPGMDAGTIKLFAIGGVAIVALGILGWIMQEYGSAVSTPVGPNPFMQPAPPAPTPAANTDDEDKKPRQLSTPAVKPTSPEGELVTTAPNAKVGSGQLYLPPLLPLGRDGEVRFYPDWIKAGGTPAPSSLKTIAVGGGLNGLDEVATLEAAFKQLPDSGGIIELVANGPYFLGPTQLTQTGTIVIRAAGGAAPVVVLVSDPDQAYDSLLQYGRGALTLEGLHFQVFARQFAGNDPLVWIDVRGGDLAAVNCSFTLIGSRSGPTFVFGAEGKSERDAAQSPSRARLLCRDCVIRGAALGAFHLDQTATELVASRSLFATGSAPVLTLTNQDLPDAETNSEPLPPKKTSSPVSGPSGTSKSPTPKSSSGSAVKSPTTAAERSLRFLSCTVLCRGTAFSLLPGARVASPPSTQVIVVNSVLCGLAGPSNSPVLLAIPGWQSSPLPGAGQSSYPKLEWVVDSSLVSGWQKLILEEPGSTLLIQNGAGWKNIWQNQAVLDESQFQTVNWPRTPPSDWATLTKSSLLLPADLGRKGTDGQPPGCPAGDLTDPTPIALARADHLADRARYPIFGWDAMRFNKPIEVDAGIGDLGHKLASENLPSDASVIVRGSGTFPTTPIVVKNKSLRIEFQSNGGNPLVLTPIPGSKPSDREAMFVVEGGSLELVGGSFRFPNGAKQAVPQVFLSVYDGDFSLKGCQVIGPTNEPSNQFSGLIRWKRSSPESKHADAPFERNSGLIVDSQFLTSNKLLEADLRNRTLVLRNSLFASINEMFDLDLRGHEGRIGGTLDAQWCTFGAGGKFLFQVQGTPGADKTTQPLSLFIEHSVLLNLQELSGSSTPPLLLSVRDHVQSNQQISWWDHGNGYQSGWSQFVRAADTPSRGPQTYEADWQRLWDGDRIARPLIASGGVRLATQLPPRTKVTTSDFKLATDCTAATWGPNQSSLGANPAGSATITRSRTPDSASPVKPNPNKSIVKPVKPGF